MSPAGLEPMQILEGSVDHVCSFCELPYGCVLAPRTHLDRCPALQARGGQHHLHTEKDTRERQGLRTNAQMPPIHSASSCTVSCFRFRYWNAGPCGPLWCQLFPCCWSSPTELQAILPQGQLAPTVVLVLMVRDGIESEEKVMKTTPPLGLTSGWLQEGMVLEEDKEASRA